MKALITAIIFVFLLPARPGLPANIAIDCRDKDVDSGGGIKMLADGSVDVIYWIKIEDCGRGDGGVHFRKGASAIEKIVKRYGHMLPGQTITVKNRGVNWLTYLKDPVYGQPWPLPAGNSKVCRAGPFPKAGGNLKILATGMASLIFKVQTVECSLAESGILMSKGTKIYDAVIKKTGLKRINYAKEIDEQTMRLIFSLWP